MVALRTQHSVEPQPPVAPRLLPTVSSFGSRTATFTGSMQAVVSFGNRESPTPTLPTRRPHIHWRLHWRRFVSPRAVRPTHRGRPSVPQSGWTYQIHWGFQARPFPPCCADIGNYQVSPAILLRALHCPSRARSDTPRSMTVN